jgi:hypothetical protein
MEQQRIVKTRLEKIVRFIPVADHQKSAASD